MFFPKEREVDSSVKINYDSQKREASVVSPELIKRMEEISSPI